MYFILQLTNIYDDRYKKFLISMITTSLRIPYFLDVLYLNKFINTLYLVLSFSINFFFR